MTKREVIWRKLKERVDDVLGDDAALIEEIDGDIKGRKITIIAKNDISAEILEERREEIDETVKSFMRGIYGSTEFDVEITAPQERVDDTIFKDYTFDNFVVGESNRLAYVTCLDVAKKPGESANPLFLYGGVGVGKTHLLHAIGNYLRDRGHRVVYVSGKEFLDRLFAALDSGTMTEFREFYRQISCLLMDDVQFLKNSMAQEEFFSIFNFLYANGKQIVITSDERPSKLKGLEGRLVSRFESGVTVGINPPDAELRRKLVNFYASSYNLELDSTMVAYIASRLKGSVRKIQGFINTLATFVKVSGGTVSVDLVRHVLSEYTSSEDEDSIDELVEVVCREFGVTLKDIQGSSRIDKVSAARHTLMYLLKKIKGSSLKEIAKLCGRKDHTTVMHAIKKIERILSGEEGNKFYNKIRRVVDSVMN